MDENNIARTTLYLPKYLHSAAKEANLNFSKEVTRYLETILFGEETSDLQYQLNKVEERIKNIRLELDSLKNRRTELMELIDEHDVKIAAEKQLYQKFMHYMQGRIKNARDAGTSFNYKQVASYLKTDYFPKNGVSASLVEQIIDRVDHDCLDFDCFRLLRKGGSFEN